MTNRPGIEEVLRRVKRFEDDLKSIGVSVRVDVQDLDVDSHECESHETETCVLCAAYERGLADGRIKGARSRQGSLAYPSHPAR